MPPQIRELRAVQELEACYSLQMSVWGADDELLDVEALRHVQEEGGILLGAFDSQAVLIGFVLSHPIREMEAYAHHSHMLAVGPRLRDRGTGLLLKQAQVRRARERGLHWLVWTFDPLEARNCHLNLNRVGARSARYFVDFYPGSRSLLHAGLETDRLLAELDLRERSRPSASGLPEDCPHVALESVGLEEGFPVPGPPEAHPAAETVLIEIPLDIQALKQAVPELALRWRAATREAFLFHLEQGFSVEGLDRKPQSDPKRVFHRLRRNPAFEGIASRLDFSSRPFSALVSEPDGLGN